MFEGRKNLWAGLIAFLLVALVIGSFWPVAHHDFINYDDPDYVTENPFVRLGLTWAGVKWAFTHAFSSNWHPLTWISHMADVQLFGLNPGRHHLVNVFFHAANSVLLFFVLLRMTGALWRCGFVAALFAVHPLHVESVAWIAERKDVLSTFFAMLTIWAYARHAETRVSEPVRKCESGNAPASSLSHFPTFYFLALIFFACGLMSKPMLVTLPLVLLLLDFWPLRRMTKDEWRARLLEKIPFFALASVSAALTIWAQQSGHSILTMEKMPVGFRLANALISYLDYAAKMFWPVNLAVFYPHPGYAPAAKIISALLFLVGVSIFAWRRRQAQPFFFVGWCWFVITLLPVIGLIQVGDQAMADRYTYIPLIGLFLMFTWGMADWLHNFPQAKIFLASGASAVVIACAVLSSRQLQFWQNTATLFDHANAVTRGNFVAQTVIGSVLASQGKLDQAIEFYSAALKNKPNYAEAFYSLAAAQEAQGKIPEALGNFREAVRLNPYFPEARKFFGLALVRQKQWAQAEEELAAALQLAPNDAQTLFNLGLALHNRGKIDQAIARYSESISLEPKSPEVHLNLANAFIARGKFPEAVVQLREVLRLNPNSIDALNRLSWILATNGDEKLRNGDEAVRLATRACELTANKQALSLLSLSVALAESGKFSEANDVAQKALALADSGGQKGVADIVQKLLQLFREGKPYREGQR